MPKLSCEEKKNKDMRKIYDKLEKLEQVMLDESGKGRYHDGRTPKANRALKRYEQLERKLTYIQYKRKC
jgi:hypothetical protein